MYVQYPRSYKVVQYILRWFFYNNNNNNNFIDDNREVDRLNSSACSAYLALEQPEALLKDRIGICWCRFVGVYCYV